MLFKDLGIKNDMPHGWKSDAPWKNKAYYMWRCMWERCKNPDAFGYEYYKDCEIYEPFRLFSNYVDWIMQESRFNEFTQTCMDKKWCVDKDIKQKGNRKYFPQYMTLTTQTENNIELENRCHNMELGRGRTRSVLALRENEILIFKSLKDAVKFLDKTSSSSIRRATRNRNWTAHGYCWLYVNYKHNKRYRIKGGRLPF